jgi:glycosyltransferase involved in cell wall biosynthesis
MKLSIVIPVYNEKATIRQILDVLEKAVLVNLEKEIILVDDCSTDGTREILKTLEQKYKVVYKEKNEGKGSAVKLGFQAATGDMLIIQDADLEYDPLEICELIKPIMENKADAVFGSRFIGHRPHRVLYFWHSIGNKFLTIFSNMLTNLNLSDMESCYKVFNRKAVDLIKDRLSSKKFGIEPELVALTAKNKLIVYEVGISYYGRTYEEGKKINWKDGLAAIWHITKHNLLK